MFAADVFLFELLFVGLSLIVVYSCIVVSVCVCVCVHVYMYIYIYIYTHNVVKDHHNLQNVRHV